jgi:peptide deformylase
MANNLVRKFGDPVLRERCEPVTVFDGDLKRFAERMFSILKSANGVGLAAPQAGDTRRLFIIDLSGQDFDSEPIVFVNPVIEKVEGEQQGEEGCLSFPGLYLDVKRPEKVTVSFQDLDGKSHRIEATGLAARAILHENDHLDGILFIDHISAYDREMLAGRLKKLKVG